MIQNLILATLMSSAIGLGNIQPRVNENWEVNTIYIQGDAYTQKVLENTCESFYEAYYQNGEDQASLNNTKVKIVHTVNNTVNTYYYETIEMDETTTTNLSFSLVNNTVVDYDIIITYNNPWTLTILDEDSTNVTDEVEVYIKNEQIYQIYSQLTANASGDMEIVETITSGLGLIGDLAQEFLLSFAHLFWDATANDGVGELTTFGIFALVMLGVAVSFAIVKLVLNIVRSNTGA